MLHNIKELYGNKIAGSDGNIGHVKDFYFDDKTWVIRYLVVDTGSWLTGRLVLLSPHAFGTLDRKEKTLHVKLHKKQIEASPSIEMHQPVSRQYEVEHYRYYGWPAYWDGDPMWGVSGFPVIRPPSENEIERRLHAHDRDDKHLQSTQAISGFQIQTFDGTIGYVTSFIVDEESWAIGELVVETGHWYSGKEILISPKMIERIGYAESKVFVNLTKEEIERSAENHVAQASV